jgi:hypothetical protein
MTPRELLIGFGGSQLQVVGHFRRQQLIELQCRRTGQLPTEAEEALHEMSPSDLALMELTGSPNSPGVHDDGRNYNPLYERNR